MSEFRATLGRIRDAWRDRSRDLKQLREFPPGRPIFIGGTHRSGTTWVAQMLAEPGIWYVHEPFNPNKGIWKQSFTYAAPNDTRPEIDTYFTGLLKGEYRKTVNIPHADHWLMPLRLIRPSIRRVMIKDPLACLLTGYLQHHFDLQSLVLFRHPAGFVSSVTRLGWPVGKTLKDFLTRRDLMNDHLSHYAGLMTKYQDRDDAAAAAVLHGALNTVQWNQVQQIPEIDYYVFEQLCQDPLTGFEQIFAKLGLPYSASTRERHLRLCVKGSSDPDDYRTHAVARNSRAMADSWKRQLTVDQVQTVREIWQQFDIPLYRDDIDWQSASAEPSEDRAVE